MSTLDFRGRRVAAALRFWQQTNTSGPVVRPELGPCWQWEGYYNKTHGYGSISVRGKPVRVHKFSYELLIGKVRDGLLVCHKCDNRRCVRPDHLFLGTTKDNAQDAKTKGRLKGKPRVFIDPSREYGYLKIVRQGDAGHSYVCLCQCGTELIVAAKNLSSGHTRSCGCYNKERLSQVHKGHKYNVGRAPPNKIDRTGKKYGRLTAVAIDKDDSRRWVCKCKCGKTASVLSTNLANYAKNNRGCSRCPR